MRISGNFGGLGMPQVAQPGMLFVWPGPPAMCAQRSAHTEPATGPHEASISAGTPSQPGAFRILSLSLAAS